MRSFIQTLLFLIAMISLPLVASAQGKGAQILTVPVDGNVSFNPCTGEGVILAGSTRIVTRAETDAGGHVHFRFMQTGQGVTGVGIDTGNRYIVSGPSPNATNTVSVDDGPSTFTETVDFHMITPGSGVNFILHVLIHMTFNANGDVTADLFTVVPECR